MFEIDPKKKYRLVITGDNNDADEISKTTECFGEVILKFIPLIEEIYNQSGHDMPDGTKHNFDIGEERWEEDMDQSELISTYAEKGISEEIIKDFIELCPSDEGGFGIHTLWKVYVEEIVFIPKKELFDIRKKYSYRNGKIVWH
jgi:hypothetical protein